MVSATGMVFQVECDGIKMSVRGWTWSSRETYEYISSV